MSKENSNILIYTLNVLKIKITKDIIKYEDFNDNNNVLRKRINESIEGFKDIYQQNLKCYYRVDNLLIKYYCYETENINYSYILEAFEDYLIKYHYADAAGSKFPDMRNPIAGEIIGWTEGYDSYNSYTDSYHTSSLRVYKNPVFKFKHYNCDKCLEYIIEQLKTLNKNETVIIGELENEIH